MRGMPLRSVRAPSASAGSAVPAFAGEGPCLRNSALVTAFTNGDAASECNRGGVKTVEILCLLSQVDGSETNGSLATQWLGMQWKTRSFLRSFYAVRQGGLP